MRRGAAAALAAVLVACGARRAPPDPVFSGPLAVDVPAFRADADGVVGTLRVRNASPFPLELTALDWSAQAGDRVVEVVGVALDVRLPPGAVEQLPLRAADPVPASPAPFVVAGTVHTRAPGGIRSAEVFRATPPAPPPEMP